MTEPRPHPAAEPHFTLLIGDTHRTYPRTKAGRRQAILDGLDAIPTVTAGQDSYLPSNAALQVVAAVLYPAGITSEAAYQTVCEVTERACAHLGYGAEVALGPPTVPFAQRGPYRKRYPPLEEQLVLDALAAAGTSSYYPRQEVRGSLLWGQAGLAVYDAYWSELTPAQQQHIQSQVTAIAEAAGWQGVAGERDAELLYCKSLPADMERAQSHLAEALRRYAGRPVATYTVCTQAQIGAYGRAFYSEDLPAELATAVAQTLAAQGYETTPTGDEYRPVPLALDTDETDIRERLVALVPVTTTLGTALLFSDVLRALQGDRPGASISAWQVEQLLQRQEVRRALRQAGYQTQLTWCQPYQFEPQRQGGAQQVLLQELRVQQDPYRQLCLAEGLAVYTPAMAIDDLENTLVYLEMVGSKQAVKANWAALVGGGRVHWLGRQRVQLEGMKQHVKIQATLPCGWVSHILIHRQASLKEMNPELPFYLLDEGTHPVPALFYPMLNKALALPLLPDWADYLWEHGREQHLIHLLDEGKGQGYAAWRVLPAGEPWQQLIQEGIQAGEIHF